VEWHRLNGIIEVSGNLAVCRLGSVSVYAINRNPVIKNYPKIKIFFNNKDKVLSAF